MDGDPSTPGWPSTEGARRLPVDSLDVPRIPVIPIGWANAAELLRDVRGADIPSGWQGAMPFRYHVGPGPVRARVLVENDTATRAMKTIWDTFGILRGSEFPDELIVIGGAPTLGTLAGAVLGGMPGAHMHQFPTSEEAAPVVASIVRPGDLVLIKGSRGTRTDIVADRLLQEAR